VRSDRAPGWKEGGEDAHVRRDFCAVLCEEGFELGELPLARILPFNAGSPPQLGNDEPQRAVLLMRRGLVVQTLVRRADDLLQGPDQSTLAAEACASALTMRIP
jgi:hypothetical protein